MQSQLRKHLCPFLLLLVLAAGCGAAQDDAGPEADTSTDPSSASEEPSNSTPSSENSSAALPEGDACGFLTVEAVKRHVAEADGAEIQVNDDLEASRYNDEARSCSWRWDGHRIDFQVTVEPPGNRFDTWASRMIAERVEARGFEPIDGLGDGAAFQPEDSDLLWRQGEGRTFMLSYGGPSPQARLDLDSLRALAAEIDG